MVLMVPGRGREGEKGMGQSRSTTYGLEQGPARHNT